MNAIPPVIASSMAAVDQLILEQLHSDVALVENIGHHIINSGGKRLRPQLVLLAAGAVGAQDRRAVHFAAIIEFIHTATLLHDDVVDMAELRRGQPTANAHWGNASSVLVGDFVYSRAFQLLVTLNEPAVLALMADTTNRIAEGEVLQLVRAGDIHLSEAQYRDVIERKTAVLFQAATRGAALLANPAQETAMARYGLALGMAFQLVDDVLDYAGDSRIMGKQGGADLSEGKLTLPLIRTLQTGTAEQKNLIKQALEERSDSTIQHALQAVRSGDGIAYTLEQARLASAEAKAAIADLPPSPERQTLLDLADSALQRHA